MLPIRIRAHNLLCLLGYRGRGYDAAFVEGMTAIHRILRADPETRVQAQASPDVVCDVCPNLSGGGCILGGPHHEAHMRAQDLDVLRRLDLVEGHVYTWREILARVAGSVRGEDLRAICTTCPWLRFGWCAEGVERVRAGWPPTPPGREP